MDVGYIPKRGFVLPSGCKLLTLCSNTVGTLTSGTVSDESDNEAPMTVNGSVTKVAAAVNSSAMMFGNWSASNYLSQAYRAALNTGVAEWGVRATMFSNAASGQKIAVSRMYFSGTYTGPLWYLAFSDGYPYFYISDDGASNSDTLTSPIKYNDGLPHTIDVWRFASTLFMAVDGVVVASAALVNATSAMDNANAVLTVGGMAPGAPDYSFDGGIAGLSIYVASYVATDIGALYADEKHLFRYGGAFGVKGKLQGLTANAGAVTASFKSFKNVAMSLGRVSETLFHGEDELISITSGVIDGLTELFRWRDFAYAIRRGDTFTLDVYGDGGTVTCQCVDDPTEATVGVLQFRMTIMARVLR